MQKKYFIIFIILAQYLHVFSQEKWTLYPKKDSIAIDSSLKLSSVDTILNKGEYIHNDGELTIKKDIKIDSLAKYIKERTNFQGYTVQLIVSQINSEIKESRNKFIENFSDEFLFDEYIAPNIYLYAGKFCNKNDAYHFKEKISSVFQNTMIIPKGFPHSNTKQKKGNQN
jgi:hypothetical protein